MDYFDFPMLFPHEEGLVNSLPTFLATWMIRNIIMGDLLLWKAS